jgi:hypothetical protein
MKTSQLRDYRLLISQNIYVFDHFQEISRLKCVFNLHDLIFE